MADFVADLSAWLEQWLWRISEISTCGYCHLIFTHKVECASRPSAVEPECGGLSRHNAGLVL